MSLALGALALGTQLSKAAITYRRPPLADYQTSSIFNTNRYAWIEASTKSGKTHGCLAWLFEQAAIGGRVGRNYWWIAPVYPQAEIAYRRMKIAIPMHLRKCNDSSLAITLPNGATITFKSGEKPDNLYGDDVYAAVIDEASRFREESWWAIRTTVTKTEAPVRIIGNVKGRKNWFFMNCRQAQSGRPNHSYAKIRAADAVAAGILRKEEIEDARSTLPEQVFKELFDAEPSDDGGNPFGLAHIAACIGDITSKLPPVAFGVDLAKSVDWTAIVGLDAIGNVVRFDRFQLPWQETIARVRKVCSGSHVLVDSTGVGDPVLETLQRQNNGTYCNFEGYKFSQSSKQQIMEGLAVGIQQRRIKIPEGILRMELESFEYQYTGRGGHSTGVRYSAPEGQHDDTVCALALAYHLHSNSGIPMAAMSKVGDSSNGRPDWL